MTSLKPLLDPSFLLIISIVFYIFKPKNINSFFGYRTQKSTKNVNNWNLANNISSKLLLIYSICIFVVSAVLLIANQEKYIYSTFIISFLCFVAFLIFYVEKKLSKL
ncbi:SdpI family protein [Cloacibacterium sp.]|uniref:SdpI family protein n=1 Tax=Cloacibacterium sp. TaxID=1913682 RepID=UPI0039E44489